MLVDNVLVCVWGGGGSVRFVEKEINSVCVCVCVCVRKSYLSVIVTVYTKVTTPWDLSLDVNGRVQV